MYSSFGELFCGAGGLSFGLKLANFEPKWGIDSNKTACETYKKNVHSNCICSKVEDIDYSQLNPVSGLAFGFPCNDFSLVGAGKGLSGYYGNLYLEAVRALKEVKPAWFIAENVPGLNSKGLDLIMKSFANAGYGYHVSVHKYDCTGYNIAQKRERIIAVGLGSGIAYSYRYLVPKPWTKEIPVKDVLSIPKGVANHEIPSNSEAVKELLSHIPPGENCWHSNVPEYLKLNIKQLRLSCLYRRLHPDKPSPTILASGGGGTYGYHYKELRSLTNRERARIQGFPDQFEFYGNLSEVRKQIGMAVPPPLMFTIGSALMDCFKGITPKGYLEPNIGFYKPDYGY